MHHPTIRITHTTFFVTPVVEHIIILFFICVCFLCLFLCVFFVCGFCMWMVGVFLTGGGCVVPCSCTKDNNSITKMMFVLFAIRVQNTGYIFLSLVHIVALGQKQTKTCISSPPVPKNRAAPVFHFILLFSNFPPENGAKAFSSTRSDIRYRLIRKQTCRSFLLTCTGDMWCQIIEAMVWPYCPESITIADLFDMVQTSIFDNGPPIINSLTLREHGLLPSWTKTIIYRCLWTVW